MDTPDLREVRRRLGLTLQQLAAKSGIQVGNLSRVERGKEFPRPARAQRLATALNLPVPQVYAAIAAKNATSDASSAEAVAGGEGAASGAPAVGQVS
jgi:transcriptional regulator with XRE-family HTH domain